MLSPAQVPSGFTPQSDGRRLIFPLNSLKGTFKTDHFLPSLVDYRCSLDDIHYFLNDIYYHTKRMSAIRVSNRLVIWSLVLFIMCFIGGISMEMQNDFDDYNGEYDDSGFVLILVGMACLIIFNIIAAIHRSSGRGLIFRQIVSTLEKHKQPFLQKGLRWAIPENCHWLELWMDYNFFSPYYMQPYVQYPNPGFPYRQPTPINRMNPPTIHSCPVQTLDNGQTEAGKAPKVCSEEGASSTVYPQFDQSPYNHYHNNVPKPVTSENATIQMQPWNQTGVYPQPQGYHYNFYQPPHIQEFLLNPNQQLDDQKLLRPY